MRKYTILAVLLLSLFNLYAQRSVSPYEWDWVTDGIWTGTALAGSTAGFLLIQNKDDLTPEELATIVSEQENINFLDKWAVGNHDETANKISDIPFAISFVAPFAMLFDDEINDHTGQYVGLYIESLATTAAIYTITAGLVNKSRPYVYDESGDTPLSRRLSGNGQRSFYSGHVAATATATFFTAKVFSDYNPDAKGKVWVWTGAALIPAGVGYFRLQGGQHFTTDIILGYALGAATGYFVPELHKKNGSLDIYPSSGQSFNGDNYKSLAIRYTF